MKVTVSLNYVIELQYYQKRVRFWWRSLLGTIVAQVTCKIITEEIIGLSTKNVMLSICSSSGHCYKYYLFFIFSLLKAPRFGIFKMDMGQFWCYVSLLRSQTCPLKLPITGIRNTSSIFDSGGDIQNYIKLCVKISLLIHLLPSIGMFYPQWGHDGKD